MEIAMVLVVASHVVSIRFERIPQAGSPM